MVFLSSNLGGARWPASVSHTVQHTLACHRAPHFDTQETHLISWSGVWGPSYSELKLQVASSLYERLVFSRNKAGIKRLAQEGQLVSKPEDILKEPLVLEFLGMDERAEYSESDLETAIISQIERFLLELGKGFLFEARQKRFTFDEDHFYVDLVFYNRLLRCYVLIDLKLDKLTHQDLGQMQMQSLLPELFVLGDYAPTQRTGPALWLRCLEARVVDGAPSSGTTPIFYLPDISREKLRAAEDCPPELTALVELLYRGVMWLHGNGKEWTPCAFLVSKHGGLGLDVAKDQATRWPGRFRR